MAEYTYAIEGNIGTIKAGSYLDINFPLAQTSKKPKKIVVNLQLNVGTATSTNGNPQNPEVNSWIKYNGVGTPINLDTGEKYETEYYNLQRGTRNISLTLTDYEDDLEKLTVTIKSIGSYSYSAPPFVISYTGASIVVNSATATVYIESTEVGNSSISSMSPSSGTYPLSKDLVFSWKTDLPGTVTRNLLHIYSPNKRKWYDFYPNKDLTSYVLLANSFKAHGYGFYYWYIEVFDTLGNQVKSQQVGFTFGSPPTTSIQYPDSSTIWRSVANTFQWSYRSGINLRQKAVEIGYKLTSTSEWTVITKESFPHEEVPADELVSYTFDANFFQYARYDFRVRVKDEDELWSDYQYKEFQAGSIPSISIKDPKDNAVLRKSQNNVISWDLNDSLNTGQKAYTFEYRLYNSVDWISNTYTSSETLHSIPANSLDMGKYSWRIKVQNNDNNWTAYTSERSFTYGIPSELTLLTPEDGSNVRLKQDLVFTWSSENEYELPQKAFEIGYRIQGASTWTTVTGTTAETYTLSQSALTYNFYEFRIRIQNTDDYWTAYQTITLDVGSHPSVDITYPFDCNIKNDIKQIFTWELTDSLLTGQKSYVMEIKHEDDTEWTRYSATTSHEYIEFDANTLETGNYQWRVKVTNNDGISTDFVTVSFTCIGITEAPVITNVTQSAIPTITWTVASQDTFEFEMYSKNERIYASGVKKGYNIRSYTPNIMIPDGNYVIKIRCMNEYGYFTEWMTYSFVLSTLKPSAVDCYIYANEYHGITIARSLELDSVTPTVPTDNNVPPEQIYVLRRVNGEEEWNILGTLSIYDETVKYIDNTVQKNVEYEYALRHYKYQGGYTDSDSHLIMIDHKGILIYDGNEYVNLYLDEGIETEIIHTPTKSFSYSYMIGREYPVKESSEWMSHTTKFTHFATIAEYNKLYAMYRSNDSLWFKGKDFSFPCSIDSITIKEALLGKGYDIEVGLSRISEEELSLF